MQLIRLGAEPLYLLNILLVLESGSHVVLDQSDLGEMGKCLHKEPVSPGLDLNDSSLIASGGFWKGPG